MPRHWREPLDLTRHRDFMAGAELGGRLREPPRDKLIPAWAYFVEVNGFTFQFASIAQLEECLIYCRSKLHPARRAGGFVLEHYWQLWFERLPKGLLRGAKRACVVSALEHALADFGHPEKD